MLSSETPEAAAYYVSQALQSGTPISQSAIDSNKYIKDYANEVNKMINTMYDGYENVSYATRDKKQRNRIIEFLGGEDNIKSLGYKLSETNRRYVISLPKESSAQLYNFINAAGDAYSESSVGHRLGQFFRREWLGGGDGFYKSDNGTAQKLRKNRLSLV